MSGEKLEPIRKSTVLNYKLPITDKKVCINKNGWRLIREKEAKCLELIIIYFKFVV